MRRLITIFTAPLSVMAIAVGGAAGETGTSATPKGGGTIRRSALLVAVVFTALLLATEAQAGLPPGTTVTETQAGLPPGTTVRETVIERPVPHYRSLLEPDGVRPHPTPPSDGGGVYPFCQRVWVVTRWAYFWGQAHYSLVHDVNYCGNGLITDIHWARTAPDSIGNCLTNWGPVMWHIGGGVGQTSVDYEARAEIRCDAWGMSWGGSIGVARRYQGDGYHYTLWRS
jgi:hypothetical protein